MIKNYFKFFDNLNLFQKVINFSFGTDLVNSHYCLGLRKKKEVFYLVKNRLKSGFIFEDGQSPPVKAKRKETLKSFTANQRALSIRDMIIT
jgi:fibronectin type 3 domain-containing protein